MLITCQIALSICAQYDLGHNTENIVNITVKGNYIDVLENKYARISGSQKHQRQARISRLK